MALASNIALVLCLAFLTLCWKLRNVGMRDKDLPPGPPTLPVIGNLHQLKSENTHLLMKEWADKYGPMFTLRFGSQTMIFLNTDQAVKDLLDKKSAITSARMDFFLTKFAGDLNVLMRSNDEFWRRVRKLYHLRLNSTIADKYVPYQTFESLHLLHDMLGDNAKYDGYIKRYTSSVGSTIIYGWRTTSPDSDAVREMFDWVAEQSTVAIKFVFADWFPILRPIFRVIPPNWNPLMWAVQRSNQHEEKLCYGLFNRVNEKLKEGRFRPCFTSDMLAASEKVDPDGLSEREVAYTTGHAWGAASDTTYATLLAFVKGIILFPEAQRKGQEEIDRVVGSGRLPEWDDWEKLPYIVCCVKESYRWLPSVPQGAIPHCITQDIEYMGYRIPAGAGLVNNCWAINNDEKRTPDPRSFNPDRHRENITWSHEAAIAADPSKRDHFNFGAGRRMCPGVHVADRNLFLAISRLLWGFNFSHALNENGEKIPIERDVLNPGYIVSCPKFPAKIEVRSAAKAELIRKKYQDSLQWLDENGDYNDAFMKTMFEG